MVLIFLIQIIVLAACIQKTGGFALYCILVASVCKICQSHTNCTRVAASCMQIVPAYHVASSHPPLIHPLPPSSPLNPPPCIIHLHDGWERTFILFPSCFYPSSNSQDVVVLAAMSAESKLQGFSTYSKG